MDGDLFAVICTASLGAQRLNTFFDMTYKNSSALDGTSSLFLVTSWDELKSDRELKPTKPPIPENAHFSFFGRSLEDITRELRIAAGQLPEYTLSSCLFAVLDERSLTEDNGLLVQAKDDHLDSARVHFDTINAELIRISMITFDVDETRELAEGQAGGVMRTKPKEPHERGKPAPRKKLCSQSSCKQDDAASRYSL